MVNKSYFNFYQNLIFNICIQKKYLLTNLPSVYYVYVQFLCFCIKVPSVEYRFRVLKLIN